MNRKRQKKFIYIRLLPAAGIYLIYILLSQILFLYTMSGWGWVIEIFRFVWVLPVIWLILLLGRLSTSGGFLRKKVFFRLIIIIAIVQFIALLVNYNDCGDGMGGQFNYIQRLLFDNFNNSMCSSGQVNQLWIPIPVILGIRIFYYFLNFIFVIFLLSADRNAKFSYQ